MPPLHSPRQRAGRQARPPVPHFRHPMGVQLVPTSPIGSLVYQFWQKSKLQLPFVEKSRSEPGFLWHVEMMSHQSQIIVPSVTQEIGAAPINIDDTILMLVLNERYIQ